MPARPGRKCLGHSEVAASFGVNRSTIYRTLGLGKPKSPVL
jgi:hypothetical protein